MKQNTIKQKIWKAGGVATLVVVGTTALWAINYDEDVSIGPENSLDVDGDVVAGAVVVDGPDSIWGVNTLIGWNGITDYGSLILGNGNAARPYSLMVGVGNSSNGWNYGLAAIGSDNTTKGLSLVVGSNNYTEQSMSFLAGSGNNIWSRGSTSFALGYFNSVNGKASGALGEDNEVSGSSRKPTIAIGEGLYANGSLYGESKVVVGKYNDAWNSEGGRVFVVGIGADEANRADGLIVKDNGDVVIPKAQGDIGMGGYGH